MISVAICLVIYRLLSCGGAEVYKLTLPVGNKSRVANLLTYVFVGERNVSEAQHLIEFGILCLRPEFIGDYILKVPLVVEFIGDYILNVLFVVEFIRDLHVFIYCYAM